MLFDNILHHAIDPCNFLRKPFESPFIDLNRFSSNFHPFRIRIRIGKRVGRGEGHALPTNFFRYGHGFVYALIGLALILVYKATDIINFAVGEMMMLSSFMAFTS